MEGDLTLLLAVFCIVVVAALPMLALLAEMVPAWGGLQLLRRWDLWALFSRSVVRALGVVLGTLAIGVPLGYAFGRSDLPFRRSLWLLHAFPLFLPPFLLGLGWFYLFDLTAIANSGIGRRLLSGEPIVWLVLTLALAPVVSALTAVALRGVEPSLEEAALVVAGPRRAAVGVLLPAAGPAVALAAIIVFALAVSELGLPLFFGARAYTETVFSRLAGIDYAPGEAVLLATPLLLTGVLLLIGDRLLFGGRRFELLGMRESRQPIPLGRWRKPATAAVLILVGAGLAPLAGLAWRAWAGTSPPGQQLAIGNSLWTSVSTSLVAASIAAVLACFVGHALVRGSRLGRVADGILFLAFLLPSAVLGVGLIAAWNRPWSGWLYGSSAILIVAGVARYSVLAVRATAIALAQSSPRLEEAGQVAGANYLRRVFTLVLRPHWRGLALAFSLTLVFCLRDLDTVVLFYPPGAEPLMVRIFTLEANGPPRVVAALALIQVAVVAMVVAGGGLLLSLGSRRR